MLQRVIIFPLSINSSPSRLAEPRTVPREETRLRRALPPALSESPPGCSTQRGVQPTLIAALIAAAEKTLPARETTASKAVLPFDTASRRVMNAMPCVVQWGGVWGHLHPLVGSLMVK